MRHSAKDGRGVRTVTLDGVELRRVLWCDTHRATAVVAVEPLVLNRKRDRIKTKFVRGKRLVVTFTNPEGQQLWGTANANQT